MRTRPNLRESRPPSRESPPVARAPEWRAPRTDGVRGPLRATRDRSRDLRFELGAPPVGRSSACPATRAYTRPRGPMRSMRDGGCRRTRRRSAVSVPSRPLSVLRRYRTTPPDSVVARRRICQMRLTSCGGATDVGRHHRGLRRLASACVGRARHRQPPRLARCSRASGCSGLPATGGSRPRCEVDAHRGDTRRSTQARAGRATRRDGEPLRAPVGYRSRRDSAIGGL